MDSLITAGARALASGDALSALNYIALRDDPPALALRGIAMAQLGDLPRARVLLRQAAAAFGPREAVARARCITAESEIALVCRDLTWPLKPLDTAYQALRRRDDHANAAHARYLKVRYLLLIGRLDDAEALLNSFDPAPLTPASRAAYELVLAGIAMRRLRIKASRAALERATALARRTRIASLIAEVEGAIHALEAPAARLIRQGTENTVRLGDIETLLASNVLVIDACRRSVAHSGQVISLQSRPILFALARLLAEASPGGASRAALLSRAFGAKHVDESHRARLRVEIGRLRKVLADCATISATTDGFALHPRGKHDVVVLAPLTDDANLHVLGLLSDGESWSSTALALALATSQRTVQRALDNLLTAGKVQAIGKARARRWMALPVPGFPTSLLLPAALPERLGSAQDRTHTSRWIMQRSTAEILREYGPFPDVSQIGGVTYDGKTIWIAAGETMKAIDPEQGTIVRSLDVPAHAGTAFDGTHLYQISGDRIQKVDPASGSVVSTIPTPDGGASGMAWAEGSLWVGQHRSRKIHQIDPKDGAILRTLHSNRFVTGVTWVDQELWHGTWEDQKSDLRRIDPRSGDVLEQVEMPAGINVSGLESNGGDLFFCGGGGSGKVRAVRKPRRQPQVAHAE